MLRVTMIWTMALAALLWGPALAPTDAAAKTVTPPELTEAATAKKAGDHAKVEALCLPLASDDKASSAVRRMAAAFVLEARARGGREGLEDAVELYTRVHFDDDAPTTGALALFDAMRLRHAMAKGAAVDAAQIAERLLKRITSARTFAQGQAFAGDKTMLALYDYFRQRHGAEGYDRLMSRLSGPSRGALAVLRFQQTKQPPHALEALMEMAVSGASRCAKPFMTRNMLQSVGRSGVWRPALGKRGYYEVLSGLARQLGRNSEWAPTVELINREATQLAVELRNDQLAGVRE